MATRRSVPPPLTLTSTAEVVRRDDPHKLRRRFIGPMPEKVISQLDVLANSQHAKGRFSILQRKNTGADEDAGVRSAIREHALQFFLGHGGREEDWDENQERSVREEMYKKWKQSAWGQARARRRESKGSASKWIGTSFDIGVFLGVDIINKSTSLSRPSITANGSTLTSTSRIQTTSASIAAETFVTAPSHPAGEGDAPSFEQLSERTSFHRRMSPLSFGNLPRPDSADSTTPLLQQPDILANVVQPRMTRREVVQRPSTSELAPIAAARDDQATKYLTVPTVHKGKGKVVHYSDSDMTASEPVPPQEVLARTGSEMEDTSAGAARQAIEAVSRPSGLAPDSDVVMRDRMMVQISFTGAGIPGSDFDESRNRRTPHVQYEDWSEYLVVWRKTRVELYKNYSIPGREWFTSHKSLAFVIPLGQGTKLSLYSFTDSTFALVCPSSPKHSRTRSRFLLYGSREGTDIFIFNVKSRTRALDWLWRLWENLGGELPTSIEVRCPTLDARLKIDLPEDDPGDKAALSVLDPSNALDLCKQALRSAEDYDEVVGRAIQAGASLELAWRMDTRLDWVWQTEDLLGNRRGWAVVYGLALKQAGKPAHLELRLQQHRTTRITLKDGTRFDEPPGIEGYLDRIRPSSQMKQALYLSTHDGYLFIIAAAHANPPPPPGPPDNANMADMWRSEAIRGGMQILQASRMADLRSIVAVRRAFQLVPMYTEEINVKDTPEWEDADGFWENVESFDDDHRDSGGEEGVAKASKTADKAQLRLQRSFELLFQNGRVVRFEAYSCHHALEWISRLRPLISYWRKRHQMEARTEMDIVYASTGRPRVTPRRHVERDGHEAPPDVPLDPEKSSPDLSSYYNWCLLDGCRAISKCGKLFGKKGLRGQYKQMQLILVAGHLVEYDISRKSLYNHRGRIIHLLDAYVCSGYLAALRLPEGQYDPDAPPLPRRYQDGLESDDLDEDTLFMVWWYSGGATPKHIPENALPPLDAKRKVSVYRTRSKLERDAWVWAIKVEVEKAVRADREREAKLRDAGGIVTKKSKK